jgi:glycosyltransferase involved in cell wall biosynthesis
VSEQATASPDTEECLGSVVAIIPAHNEERFIGSVVLKASQYAATVIVVDDGSDDATAEIAKAAGATVLRHPHNLGKGVALNTGFRAARNIGPAAVVILDADGQHAAQQIPQLAKPVLEGRADMVVGSRFMTGSGSVPPIRALGLRAVTVLSNLGSRLPLSDSQTGFRAFSPAAVDQITFTADGFSVESEMQFLARQLKLRTVEVPISCAYTDRPKRSVVGQGLEVLNGVLRLIGQHRPLLFLGVPGAAALLFGLWWGVRVVDIYRRVGELAVGYTLVGVLLCILGSIALSTGIILHSLRALLLELLGPKKG